MKILIIDDDFANRQKMNILLKAMGHETLMAEDDCKGFSLWLQHSPGIVITDWMMPELSGVELCKKIRANESLSYTYLIMVTSREATDDIITGMDAGADDFIIKPYAKEVLQVRVRAGERVLENQMRDLRIFSLAKLAASRDEDTGHHLERIRFYSKALAETLSEFGNAPKELNRKLINYIFYTSPLHDIGKIGIPDCILLKAGKLREPVFKIMQQHSKIGFDTLNNAAVHCPQAEFLKVGAQIARSHHECFDGSGYPDGLSGNRIPLAARIVALADTYDALVTERVFKAPFPHQLAKEIIINQRGTYFDPMVVDAFLRCEEEFKDIFERFKDGEELSHQKNKSGPHQKLLNTGALKDSGKCSRQTFPA